MREAGSILKWTSQRGPFPFKEAKFPISQIAGEKEPYNAVQGSPSWYKIL